MPRAIQAVLAILLLALALQADGASAGPKKDALKAALWKRLENRGLDVKNVNTCRPQEKPGIYICTWRAEGIGEGDVPYRCAGTARYNSRKPKEKRWRIDRCTNREALLIPLLPEPGPHPYFGIHEEWHKPTDAETGSTDEAHAAARAERQRRYDLLAGLGANVGRTGLFWEAVERSRGSYDWHVFDEIYEDFLARGIQPLWVIWIAPCWAQPDPAACRAGQNQLHPAKSAYDDYARFAALAAQRYPQALGIELWNEPNWDVYWGAEPDPESYADLVKQAAQAVEAANPRMPTITAGLAPFASDNGAGRLAYDGFLDRAYEAGGPQKVDAIGAHPYPPQTSDEDYIRGVRGQIQRYRSTMAEHDEGSTPIWVTETGISTVGPGAYDEQQQAQALSEIYTLFRRISGIPVVVFHRMFDTPSTVEGIGEQELGFGLVAKDSTTLKPSYCAVAAAREHPC